MANLNRMKPDTKYMMKFNIGSLESSTAEGKTFRSAFYQIW